MVLNIKLVRDVWVLGVKDSQVFVDDIKVVGHFINELTHCIFGFVCKRDQFGILAHLFGLQVLYKDQSGSITVFKREV